MKKKLHTIFKLLLVVLIFTGLQGRVIIRYAEFLNKNLKSEISSSKGIHVRAAIIHCKLQCYTQKFQSIAVPSSVALLSFVLIFIVIIRVYIPFREHLVLVNPVPLLPLRAPPRVSVITLSNRRYLEASAIVFSISRRIFPDNT